jgi:hypothetical protein
MVDLTRAKIYVDLDGVLADFDKRYDEVVGGRDKLLDLIKNGRWVPR